MIRIHGNLARIMEAIGKKFGAETSLPDGPPPGWSRRTTRLPNGYLVSVDIPVPDPGSSGYVLLGHKRTMRERYEQIDRKTNDGVAPLSSSSQPLPSGSPEPFDAGVRDPCPLLVDFLERRARR
jgi:hypothetical protein